MRRAGHILVLLVLLSYPGRGWGQDELLERTPPPKVLPMAIDATPQTVPPPLSTEAALPDSIMDDIEQAWDDGTDDTPDEDEENPTNTASATGEEDGRGEDSEIMASFFRALMALCVTLALFLLCLAALKRWGRRTPLLAGHSLGTVMGRISLSPQASLHFVRVQDEVLVVGVTPQAVNLLRTLDADQFESLDQKTSEAEDIPGAEPVDFLAQLRSSQTAMTTPAASSSGMDEELDTLKGDLQRLKQYFQESTRERD